ncbi:MAG: hypothetical protein HY735_13330 [Verrucomicrobia bacterium]|nr:hypothetical protein [Verrucomicrobiota bacterium]
MFQNGDTLYGRLQKIDPVAGIVWRHPYSDEVIEFITENISEVRFGYRPQPQLNATNFCLVRLSNQDELEGSLVVCTPERLVLQTSYGGKLEIPRKYVQVISPKPVERPPIYEGPSGLEGWTMGIVQAAIPNSGQWSYKNGAFYATQSASIARELKLPDMASLECDLNWKGMLYIAIALYTDYMHPINLQTKETGPDFGGFYSLQLNSYTVNLLPVSKHEPLRYLGQTSVPAFNQKNKVHLEIRVNKPKRMVALMVDGVLVKQWIDSEDFVGKGTGIRLVHQGQGSVKLSNLRVSEWDGQFEEKPSNTPDAKQDQARLQNGDKVAGTLERIQDGKVTFSLPEGANLDIPLSRVKLVEMASQKLERPRENLPNVRATFRRGGSISFRLEKWDPPEVSGSNPCFGRFVFDSAAFERVQFLPITRPKPTAGALRDLGRGRAVVRAVRGQADYHTGNDDWKTLTVGKVLPAGSVIRTGADSLVDLFLGENGPTVRVTPETLLGLSKLDLRQEGIDVVAETLLKLDKGRIQGHVRKLAPGSSWEVQTAKRLVVVQDTGGFEIAADRE